MSFCRISVYYCIMYRPTPKSRSYSEKPFFLYRLLFLLILFMIGVLALGTIYAFTRPPNSAPLFRIGNTYTPNAVQQRSNFQGNESIGIFSGIGRLRIPLADSSTLILSIAFPYPLHDRAFVEELAARTGDFRTIATNYFASLPAASLATLNEETARAEILRQYNTSLRLGRIETLYFHDLIIIE